MGNLANKLNKAYAGEVKQALKAKSRSKELESLKLKLEDTKKNALETFTQSEEYNHEMVECFNNGFEMFRDYASVIAPDHNWSEIDVAGVWQAYCPTLEYDEDWKINPQAQNHQFCLLQEASHACMQPSQLHPRSTSLVKSQTSCHLCYLPISVASAGRV
ncbi:hypothetical protein L3X38_009630 [Prunus dulcis]|uniref:Uncharacterized protein n=1 Tax=Prunus dulcis TaxID=3755 RepID=A0AAD4ZD95_PRUDU|nr:hypothetical protein L3X38_009630 [Prunus dulcis]